MAAHLYPTGAAHLLGDPTDLDLVADTLKLLCYEGAYNAAHEYVSDLTGADIVDRSPALAGKTVGGGVLDATDPVTLPTLTGDPFSAVILYVDTGADATSALLAYFDVDTFTPNGLDVHIVFNPAGLLSIAD